MHNEVDWNESAYTQYTIYITDILTLTSNITIYLSLLMF